MTLYEHIKNNCGKELDNCTDIEIYESLTKTIKEIASKRERNESQKKLYYISAEFLIGKLLTANLINLGIYDEVCEILETHGHNIRKIEELEAEPSLGNGGLGRLAACFLDSVATLKLNGDGIGLNYHFGLFKQIFRNNLQCEEKNPWICNSGFLNPTDISYEVNFKDLSVTSRLYDIDIIGYKGTVNKLHLFDIESIDESIVKNGCVYDKTDITKNLTLFLYPDDSDKEGKLLRIYQQYFMVSSAAELILDESIKRGSTLYDLPDYAVIQINDTHPSLIIPELIRRLVKKGIDTDYAIDIVTRCCAYTNHTILSESLEKWPLEYLKETIPHIIPIIETLDKKIKEKFSDPSVYIIDKENLVHMAHIAIHFSMSTNGVAHLHTEILKNTELNNFYKLYPKKFNNKTNGITFRRWLIESNPALSSFIHSIIGDGFYEDENELKKLTAFRDDIDVLDKLLSIKYDNKKRLCGYIKNTQGIDIDPNSVFDIQIKRIHEYKRQQMNALCLIRQYLEIKRGHKPKVPVTVIFGGKAAPAYTIAKDIIHLILCLQEIINNDKDVSPYLKVVMIENYNITSAQILIPACDVSEQISLASKEASGTGNMKFMLNGAVTLGTEDGANVEIHSLVGDDNIYIFGNESDKVIERYNNNSYNPKEFYTDIPKLKEAVDFITSDILLKAGRRENLERLQKELINKDYFMTFPDFMSYVETKKRVFADYENRIDWARKMLINIAESGYFSSDRTIKEYNKDIWKL